MVELKDFSITTQIRRLISRVGTPQLDRQALLRWLAQASLGLTIFFTPFRVHLVLYAQPMPPIFADYTDLIGYLSDIFMIIALAFWGISLLVQPRRISFGPWVLSIPLAGIVLMGWISVIFSVSPLLSAYHAVRLVLLALFYLFLVNELDSLWAILWAAAAGLCIQASVAIVQSFKQASIGLRSLGELNLNPAWSGISIVWSEGVRTLRAYGLTDHPNILGGCLAFALVLLVCWYVTATPGKNLILASVILLGLQALFVSFSRSAWLGLFSGLMVVAGLLFYSRQQRALANWIVLMAAGAIIMVPLIWQNARVLGVRLGANSSFQQIGPEAQSIQERVVLDSAANQIFAGHAVTGIGLGASPIALRQARPVFQYYYQPAHFVLLDVATETGIFGALFYFLILVTPWLALIFYRKRLNFSMGLIAASGALAAITVVGFFDYYPWLLTAGRTWQWLIWGLWAASFQMSAKRVQENV